MEIEQKRWIVTISYINNAFSEYIGSNVFRIVGFKTQNTILGKYKYKKNSLCMWRFYR